MGEIEYSASAMDELVETSTSFLIALSGLYGDGAGPRTDGEDLIHWLSSRECDNAGPDKRQLVCEELRGCRAYGCAAGHTVWLEQQRVDKSGIRRGFTQPNMRDHFRSISRLSKWSLYSSLYCDGALGLSVLVYRYQLIRARQTLVLRECARMGGDQR